MIEIPLHCYSLYMLFDTWSIFRFMMH